MPGPIQQTTPAGAEIHTILPTAVQFNYVQSANQSVAIAGYATVRVTDSADAFLFNLVPEVVSLHASEADISALTLSTSGGLISGAQLLEAVHNLFNQLYLAAP
jgi:hypothetical protein